MRWIIPHHNVFNLTGQMYLHLFIAYACQIHETKPFLVPAVRGWELVSDNAADNSIRLDRTWFCCPI